MPTLKPPPDLAVYKFPKPLQDYLDFPQPEGTRNDALLKATIQARDARWSESDSMLRLMPLATDRDGLPSNEAKATINSAYTRAPREDVTRMRGAAASAFASGTPFKKAPKAAIPKKEIVIKDEFVLPDEIELGAVHLLEAMFRPGERIMIASAIYDPEKDKETVGGEAFQQVWERDLLIDQIKRYKGDCSRFFEHEFTDGMKRGVYFCINPLGESERRITENITDFRHILLEIDKIPSGKFDEEGKPIMEPVPKERQFQIFEQSGAPIVGISDGGNISLHIIVRSNSKDSAENRDRAYAYMDFFKEYGVDKGTKDATRFSRLPGATRFDSGGRQRLLALKLGADSYEAWMSELTVTAAGMPRRMRFKDLLLFNPKEDPDALIGTDRFLTRGMPMILAGQSGIGKSSFGAQMCLSWCLGKDFFGIPTVKGKKLKVMVIQAENNFGDMSEVCQGMKLAMELTEDEINWVDENFVMYEDRTHTQDAFLEVLTNLIVKDRPDLVLVDPLYSYAGDDLTKPQVIANFFTRGITPIAKEANAAIIFMHHVPKPPTDAANKRKGRELSYAGAGHANLTNWTRAYANLEPVGATDCFTFTLSKREKRSGMLDEDGKPATVIHVQHAKEGIYWIRADKGTAEEGAAEKKTTGRPPTDFDPSEKNLGLIKKAMAKFPDGISGRNLKALLATLKLGVCAGFAVNMGATKCYQEVMPALENSGHLKRGSKGFIFIEKPTDSTSDSDDSETTPF